MKFVFDQEWLKKHADDEDLEIAAGSFLVDQLPPASNPSGDLRSVEREIAAMGKSSSR